MRPNDLQPPVSREQRTTVVHDRVWYVPKMGLCDQPFLFPGWSHPDLFGNDQPVYIEYCSGNGLWIAEKAMAYPGINWVAVERKFERVKKTWSKIKNLHLNNLIVVCGEAYHATEQYIPTNSIAEVFINFPDPWPKTRHSKNRLIQSEFVAQMARILAPQGKLTFVTDDVNYSKWFIHKMQASPWFSSLCPDPYYITDLSAYGTSYFNELWRSQGRVIYYHQFQRVSACPVCT